MNDKDFRQLEDDILRLKTKLEFYPGKATLEEIKTFIVKEHADAQKWITGLTIALSTIATAPIVELLRK